MLIIAGGRGDPDLEWLAHAAEHRGLPHFICYCNSHDPSGIEWDLGTNSLILDGQAINSENASLYIRYSMFDSYGEDSLDDCMKLVENWYQTMKGWAHINPDIGMFNRNCHVLDVNKPYNLLYAQKCGFSVPETKIINQISDAAQIKDPENWIIKVVGDGESTRLLSEISPDDIDRVFKARPWIIQKKLLYPELRIFRVGQWQFAFEINASVIDSRTDDDQDIMAVPVPKELGKSLNKLTDHLGMDFAAADFKTCPETGEYLFLEINSAPTFSGYDAKIEGRLSDAMIIHLKKLGNIT